MNSKINVVLLETLLPETELELSGLLTEVVEDGASIGFLLRSQLRKLQPIGKASLIRMCCSGQQWRATKLRVQCSSI